MDSDWKASKEAFVTGHTGSTISHINTISAVALSSIALHSAIRTSLNPNVKRPQGLVFLASFLTLVVPLLLSMTLFAEMPGLLNVLLLIPALLVEMAPKRETAVVLPSANPRPSIDNTIDLQVISTSRQNSPTRLARLSSPPPRAPSPFLLTTPGSQSNLLPQRQPSPSPTRAYPTTSFNSTSTPPSRRKPPLPAVTTWRAHMLLMTFLGILAVDFKVFPRALAKCEDLGVSLMDLGVGSFVFAQGVVAAIPLLRETPYGEHPHYITAPMLPKLLDVAIKAFPVILLGLIRVVLVKGSGYPEHVTEYGVHWNFFITLALVPLLQVGLHPLISGRAFGGKIGPMPVVVVGMGVAFTHQFGLCFGLSHYVRLAPRLNLISANKEGIVSLGGYLAIHLLGVSTGTLVLPQSPSYFRRRQLQIARHGTLKRRDSNATMSTGGPPDSRASFDSQDSDGGRGQLDSATTSGRRSGNFDRGRRSMDSVNGDGTEISTTSTVNHKPRQDDKAAIELFSYTFVWWVLLGFTRLLNVGGGVSRLVSNLSYILWITAFNTSFLLGYLLLDLYYFPASAPSRKSRPQPPADARFTFPQSVATDSRYSSAYPPSRPDLTLNVNLGLATDPSGPPPNSTPAGNSPSLLEAINKNGLVLFLLANVLTGLINFTLPTIEMSDAWSMVVLLCYTFVVCATAWAFREHRIWKL